GADRIWLETRKIADRSVSSYQATAFRARTSVRNSTLSKRSAAPFLADRTRCHLSKPRSHGSYSNRRTTRSAESQSCWQPAGSFVSHDHYRDNEDPSRI